MCRQAFFPPDTDVGHSKVEELLSYWMKGQGGDGAGVVGRVGDKIHIMRGMKANAKTLAEFMKTRGNEKGWLFHTRLASSGPKVEELVQPFVSKEWAFTHNGHWNDWDRAFWAGVCAGTIDPADAVNDSKTVFGLLRAAGPGALLRVPSGVFLSWYIKDPVAWLTLQSGQFEYTSLPDDGGIVYGSSFPYDWPMKSYSFSDSAVVELKSEGPRLVSGTVRGPWKPPVSVGVVVEGTEDDPDYAHAYGITP